MTRKEMIGVLSDYCHKVPVNGCLNGCPLRKVPEKGIGCESFEDRTDEELAACIEKITPAPVVEETAAQVCEKVADEEVPPVEHKVVVNRDEMCEMKGKLLMLSCCAGVTITSAMVDELLIMAGRIDDVLSESEEAIG